jgi:hypothetical protein
MAKKAKSDSGRFGLVLFQLSLKVASKKKKEIVQVQDIFKCRSSSQ